MVLREIIKIDEEKCTGCGACVPNCPEGALQVIDGKARLVSDLFCDGLGACIGECPEGAISVEKREAEPYDEAKVMVNIIAAGENTIRAHLDHLRGHGELDLLARAEAALREAGVPVPPRAGVEVEAPAMACGCPSTMVRDFRGGNGATETPSPARDDGSPRAGSELKTWPIQLHLLNPHVPFFRDADLVIAADCVGFASPNFHQDFLRGKVLVILCPKLDHGTDTYVDKLAEVFKNQSVKSVTVVHMEVPCCFGLNQIVGEALRRAGEKIPVEEVTISVKGTPM
ncbi:MAG: ATP-binding protein [Promethearchaeota archaeon]